MVRIKTRQEIKRRKVTFSLENADANEVFLIGDFNKWNPKSHPIKSDENGAWVQERDNSSRRIRIQVYS